MLKNSLLLGLILLFGLNGCNSLPIETSKKSLSVEKKDLVPEEIKAYAKNAINYGDYYLKEFAARMKEYPNEPVDTQPLKTGLGLISEERDGMSELSKRLLPKLSPESAKLSKQCYLSLFEYSIHYVNLQAFVLGSAISYDESKFKTGWDGMTQSRLKTIKGCQLAESL